MARVQWILVGLLLLGCSSPSGGEPSGAAGAPAEPDPPAEPEAEPPPSCPVNAVACNDACLSEVGEEGSGCRVLSVDAGPVRSMIRYLDHLILGYDNHIERIDLATLERTVVARLHDEVRSVGNLQLIGDDLYFSTIDEALNQPTLERVPALGGQVARLAELEVLVWWIRAQGPMLYFRDGRLAGTVHAYDTTSGVIRDLGIDGMQLEIYGDVAYHTTYSSAEPFMVSPLSDLENTSVVMERAPFQFFPVEGGVYWLRDEPEYWWVSAVGGEPRLVQTFDPPVEALEESGGRLLLARETAATVEFLTMPLEGSELTRVSRFHAAPLWPGSKLTPTDLFHVVDQRFLLQVALP